MVPPVRLHTSSQQETFSQIHSPTPDKVGASYEKQDSESRGEKVSFSRYLHICSPHAEATMLSKCANPGCSTAFRYLREGKLFEIDNNTLAAANADAKKPVRRVEFFWLCGPCSSE